MPPKQKMGSITHNSAEVNQRQDKRGMLSKLKGSFVGSSTKNVSSKASTAGSQKSTGSKTAGGGGGGGTGRKNLSKSVSTTAQYGEQGERRAPRRLSSSYAPGDSGDFKPARSGPIDGNKSFTPHGGGAVGGVPLSITALVDAASVLTDDMMTKQTDAFPPNIIDPPLGLEPKQGRNAIVGTLGYGTTESASRALANLYVSGGGLSGDQLGKTRNGSARQQHPMALANNAGYNNYDYDEYGDDACNQADYHDASGGGIFDDDYMRSSNRMSVSAHHPPPREVGYNRRSSNASSDEYMQGFRRSSNGEDHRHNSQDAMPGYYKGASQGSYSNNDYSPNGGSGGGGGNNHYHEGLMSSKRSSIDNSDFQRRRRTTVGSNNEYDPRTISVGEKWHHSMGHRPSADIVPSPPQNLVINNNGRGDNTAGYNSSGSSRTERPRQGGGERRMSVNKGNYNPTWFNENEGGISSGNRGPLRQPLARSSISHGGCDDDDRTMTTMATRYQALRPSAMSKAKDMSSPDGDVTIVYTDVQGSTSLWETCPSDMKTATDIHDIIMRQCYTNHSGYEITTEGDAFNLAFQHPVDALAFALQAQLKLYKADWPDGILRHPDGKDELALKFRGFRVRFGIHHGPTTSRVHEMTGRTVYSGEGVKIAKAVEGMCHGGQILTTMETWKAVSGMAERYLGRPQILDCGEHLLFEMKNSNPGAGGGHTTTRYTRRIMQLVPSDLAFDFFEARGRRDVPSEDGKMEFEIKDAASVNGRLFPPLTSNRQLTTCFLNAPYANGRVTICFVYTVGLDDNPDNRAHNLGLLAKYLRKQLLLLNPPGYECQEDDGCWMLAFDRMAHAVTFGLQLKSTLGGPHGLVGSVDRDSMFKVGILSGPFTSMGPHKTTGMADYFGPIVNRAARVASSCEPGQVCVGIPLANGVTADPPDFGPTVNVRLLGIKKLKGITIDVAIFECSKRRIETL